MTDKPPAAGPKRLSNSELRLARLDEEELQREKGLGIFELFGDANPDPDEDAPLVRDEDVGIPE